MTSMQADQPTNHIIIDLYVVQRCWFSGPKTFAPVEYARLFSTAADAESLAHQSAHAFALQHQEPVRTLQLQSGGKNSYGFVAAGSLFWIRLVKALVVGDGGGGADASGAHALLACNQQTLWSPAGTNARRINTQSTQHPPAVFVGSSSLASAQQFASAIMQEQQQQQRQQSHVRVVWLPIGQLSSIDYWWREWPDKCVSDHFMKLQQQQQQQQLDANKRGSCYEYTTLTTTTAPGPGCGAKSNLAEQMHVGSDVDHVMSRPTKRQHRVQEPSSSMTMKWQ